MRLLLACTLTARSARKAAKAHDPFVLLRWWDKAYHCLLFSRSDCFPPAEKRHASHLGYINKLPLKMQHRVLGASGIMLPLQTLRLRQFRKCSLTLTADNALSVTIFQLSLRHTFVIKLYPQPFTIAWDTNTEYPALCVQRELWKCWHRREQKHCFTLEVGWSRCEKPIWRGRPHLSLGNGGGSHAEAPWL